MPYKKLKSENYQNFGGINSKYSSYNTGPMEFLELTNLDFQTPGALTGRWGSTQYIGQTFPGQINSLFEFSRLDGSSQVVISYSGGIFAGATTGNSQGLSMAALGATTTAWGAVNLLGIFPPVPSGSNSAYMYSIGAYYLGETTNLIYGQGNGVAIPGQGNTFFINPVSVQSDNILSNQALNNFSFIGDGSKFIKYDGATAYAVGLPPPLWATNGVFDFRGNVTQERGFGSVTGSSSGGIGFQYGPSLGFYYLFASYVNNRGFEGPIWPLLAIRGDNQFNASLLTSLAGAGSTGILQVSLIIATPLQYGISSINVYSFYDPYNTSIGQTYTNFLDDSFYDNVSARFWNLQTPVLLQSIPASGSTFTSFGAGTSLSGQPLLQANTIGSFEVSSTSQYFPPGLTLGASLPSKYAQYAALTGYWPRFIETYQNRLFLAGFSATPSTVWFSEIAEPEAYAPNFNFEVRTNDADVITCIKSYTSRFYIFKKNSFHVLSGDNPNNFFLQQVTDQYGCLNNRSAVVFDDLLVFLDRKGLILWNGSSVQVLSTKIQPTFEAMNYSAAINSACMVHDKLRNQVLCAIPINGSATNNVVVVYDYVAGAITKYDGVLPSAFAAIQGRNNSKNAFYGDYSGRVNWFGPSFLADNGVGFTTYMKTRFLHDQGNSVQKMFRRLYINADSPASSTLVFGVNFFQDYGATVVKGTTMVLSQFQNRIDYGISAKSIAFEMSNIQTNMRLRVYGFTIESRYLRAV